MEHGKLGPFSLESALINQGQMGGSEVVIDLAHQSSAFHFARRPTCSAAVQKKKIRRRRVPYLTGDLQMSLGVMKGLLVIAHGGVGIAQTPTGASCDNE